MDYMITFSDVMATVITLGLGVIGFFMKRWISDVEQGNKALQQALENTTDSLNEKIEQGNRDIHIIPSAHTDFRHYERSQERSKNHIPLNRHFHECHHRTHHWCSKCDCHDVAHKLGWKTVNFLNTLQSFFLLP